MKSKQVIKKKLIEVALPLDSINDASSYDKMPGIGAHPKGIHWWWARLPLPCARAVILASLIDDPGSPKEREKIFELIRRLVAKDAHKNPAVFAEAEELIQRATDGNPPAVIDPFCGGGSIPLEAARLGLRVITGDLNPVPCIITKYQLEFAPRFDGQQPISSFHDESKSSGSRNNFAAIRGERLDGAAEDIKFYGKVLHERISKKIGKYYPQVQSSELGDNEKRNVIAWLWARTVKSPNPALNGAEIPLVRSFILASKGKKKVAVVPEIGADGKSFRFVVHHDCSEPPKGTITRRGAKCIYTDDSIPLAYIREQGKKGKLGCRLMAVVVDLGKGRTYVSPTSEQENIAKSAINDLDFEMSEAISTDTRDFRTGLYGMHTFDALYSPRQLLCLSSIVAEIHEVHELVFKDAKKAGLIVDDKSLADGGSGALAYADFVAISLGLVADRCADFCNSLATWKPSGEQVMHLFVRQAIPMVWDYAETNLLSSKGVCWLNAVEILTDSLRTLFPRKPRENIVNLSSAEKTVSSGQNYIVSTDPPYFDNISYSDLSDFFYVWLRRSVGRYIPKLFQTVLTPKLEELIVNSQRHSGDRNLAQQHFESGFLKIFKDIWKHHSSDCPMTVYYAFKQQEEIDEVNDDESDSTGGSVSTGWESLLQSLIDAGFVITGTLPVHASQKWRMVSMGTNALASYIVIVCRKRERAAETITRREFMAILKEELPDAISNLKSASIAATDLAQAVIGPGMGVFSRYSSILEADGKPMSVRIGLSLINEVLDQVNSEGEGEFDPDSRWAIAWFETHGFEEGSYGEAETLSKAKNTSTSGLVEAGVITSKAGKVKLIPIEALPEDWNPKSDTRLTVWEVTHHLIRVLETKGEEGAAALMKDVGAIGEVARDLAYRLYSICERKKWAKDALRYNGLIVSWSGVSSLSQQIVKEMPKQTALALGERGA